MPIDRDKIKRILTERHATKPCHRCGSTGFTVIDGYSKISIQDIPTAGLVVGGPVIPVALIVCDNCGAVTTHALGALNLLLENEEGKNGKKQ